ncbi:MAG: glycosyltransferase family 2 protein [Thermosediminibacteraceae bacterium]|nr:glycosyltransferase family 2 protein [Thermosediminibacteraceae bacterium]
MNTNQTTKPLVTIGIPFFNPGCLIIDAIRSVFAQTYTNWELFLVDDGSTDGSTDIVSKIRDPRVHVISDGKNKGLVERLNQIVRLASGKYIARMDADDLMHPERIEKQVAFLEANPGIDVVDTGAIILNKEGLPVGVGGLDKKSFDKIQIFKWGLFLHPSVMGKRDWFIENPYDPDYPRAEDRELFIRTLPFSHFSHIPEPLLFYRFEGNVRLRAYLTSYSSERKVLLKYGSQMIGWPTTLWLYSRSLVKSGVLLLLSAVKSENLITRNKYKPIPKALYEDIERVLKHIYRVEIPGF